MSDEQRNLPPDRLWQPTTAKWFAVIFGTSLAYAVIRYHLAGDVEWRHFPLCYPQQGDLTGGGLLRGKLVSDRPKSSTGTTTTRLCAWSWSSSVA